MNFGVRQFYPFWTKAIKMAFPSFTDPSPEVICFGVEAERPVPKLIPHNLSGRQFTKRVDPADERKFF
jgi:hypothetical protein